MSPEAAQLHASSIVVDTHDDYPALFELWHRDAELAYDWVDQWLPVLRAGGVKVQVLPICILPQDSDRTLRRILLAVEMLRERIEAHPDDVALCTTGTQVREAVASGRLAVMLALEGIAGLGPDVELIRTLYRLGVRMASLAHFGRTPFADGSGEDATRSRLTVAGVAAVRLMNRLPMLIDISHLSAAGVDHLLGLTDGPVVASHSSAARLRRHHRNLPDRILRAVGEAGGVIGVNFYPDYVAADPTIDDVVDHIDHIADIAGIDHVGIGADFIDAFWAQLYPPLPGLAGWKHVIPYLEGPADLPRLTDRLLGRGFSDRETRRILGENTLALFDRVLG